MTREPRPRYPIQPARIVIVMDLLETGDALLRRAPVEMHAPDPGRHPSQALQVPRRAIPLRRLVQHVQDHLVPHCDGQHVAQFLAHVGPIEHTPQPVQAVN
jgi:hypothetical protein